MILRTSVYSASFVVALLLGVVLVGAHRDAPPADGAVAQPITLLSTQTITICKTTVPPGATGFPFTWLNGSTPQTGFTLDDTQCNILDVTLIDKFNTIAESPVPSGWTLTNIVCVAATSPITITGANANPAFQPGDNTVIIDLNEANVTCTFTNTQDPTHTPTTTPCPPAVCPDTGTPTATPCPIGAICPTATPCGGAGAICTPTATPCVPAPCQATPTPTATATPTATQDPTNTHSPTPTPRLTIGPIIVIWGDTNCSDHVDPVDSLVTLRFDAGLDVDTGDCPGIGDIVDVANASLHPWGDIDCSGEVNPVDSLKLLRYDAGLDIDQEADCPAPGEPVTVT